MNAVFGIVAWGVLSAFFGGTYYYLYLRPRIKALASSGRTPWEVAEKERRAKKEMLSQIQLWKERMLFCLPFTFVVVPVVAVMTGLKWVFSLSLGVSIVGLISLPVFGAIEAMLEEPNGESDITKLFM